ncbi:MAG: glutathione peroxidase [Edaphocola sp.]
MKYTILFMSFLFFGARKGNSQDIPKSIYDFKVESLTGGQIDFSTFRGKKILIVNTASKCGFTPQYAELEELSKKYQGKLVIVGFPANNFLFQEPKGNSEIAEFCQKNYGVTFPMAAKISVKGKDMAPIYQWLTNKDYNEVESSSVSWNFQKYLIDERGKLVTYFPPKTKPLSAAVIKAIEE